MNRRLLSPLALAGLLSAASAQQEILKPFRNDDGGPIPRAEAVRPPRALPAEPVATPLPMNTPAGRLSPGSRRAKPSPAATPIPNALPPSPEPADPSDIRLSPQAGARSPEQAQFDVANSYYAREMYDVAAPEYQRFLDNFPGSPEAAAATFRLAESHRKNGSTNSAKAAYEALLGRFPVSEFTGAAAYRLATLYYQERNYTSALPYYRKAAAKSKEAPVVNAAKFYSARCLESSNSLGNKLEAVDLYRDLAEAKEGNVFSEASRLSLALLLREANRTLEALKNIQILAKQTQNPELKARATVRAGLWELDLKQHAKAAEDLQHALEMPGIGALKEEAQLGLLKVYYDTGKYKEVIDGYQRFGAKFGPESQAEVLLLLANSQRRTGHPAEALALYDQIAKDYPSTPSAHDAGYERLVTLYNTNSEKLVPQIDAYLGGSPDPQTRDQVMLMKAEALLKKQDFPTAGAAYAQLTASTQLTGTLKAECFYKLGWCLMQTRDFDGAIKAYTRLIEDYPTNKSLCSARVQRAVANQSLKNLTVAEKDYVEVIKRFPKCPERELALQQEALIRGQQNDNAGMSDNFQLLLKDFPQSPAAAQAHFWIGRTAYETKDYKRAVPHLDLARKLDKEQFFERASLPLMLAYYYLEDRSGVARELDLYRKEGKTKSPVEVLRWVAEQYFDSKSFEDAEKYLQQLAERDDVAPKDLLKLGQVRLQLAKYPEAITTFQKYLAAVHEPVSRATGLLELARAQIAGKELPDARKSIEETLTLQPEGRISGEARILAGDIEAAGGAWEAAAKTYASVAVIIDEEEVTPRALEKAVEAYQKAGKEAEAKKTLNVLQSRYPEFFQKKKVAK